MEDKLVTLAILTYTKAQILKNVLENEGIETYIHNVNQIQPVVSSGVRLRIKESDLPRALKITESSTWLSESIVGEKEPKVKDKSNKILIPVDFSNYSMKACEFAFNLAKTENAEVILLHVYFTPIYASSLPYGDVFNYQIGDEESVKTIIQKVHSDLNALSEKIKEKVTSGEFPNVKYSCILREGIPEEEILRYAKEQRPMVIIMGTRGKNQKDIDLIGSVTAEVIDRSRTAVLAIPENTPFKQFSEANETSVFYYRRNSAASTLNKDNISEEMIQNSKIIHITGVTSALSGSCAEMNLTLAKKAKKNGVLVSFDPNIRLRLWSKNEAAETLRPLLDMCDIVEIGLDEAKVLLML